MKKLLSVILIACFSLTISANEGMWLPLLIKRLNHVDMQKHGLKLTAEEIYSVNNSSLKDAIVALGGGFCTGEMISKDGLMLTNHHCGFDAIQENSTPEHNYLADGFWAMSRDKEIPVPGLTAYFLNSMDDVTAKMLNGVTDAMSEDERAMKIAENKKAYMEVEGPKFDEVQVKSFFDGNEYYVFRYNIFKDIRLVGAPPSSVGKFGGDTDNWMWPRHTGDFCMFRVYSDKDNNAAEYSASNVVHHPKHHLPISLSGVQEGDFAMVMGYPGSTDRYLTSEGVKQAAEVDQPARVKVRRMKLDIIEEGQAKSEEIRIQYASKHARISNYWKYFQGQSMQLVKNGVFEKKTAIEKNFEKWAMADNARVQKYGGVVSDFKKAYADMAKYTYPDVYLQEAVFGPDCHQFAWRNFGMRAAINGALEDEEKLKSAKEQILAASDDYFKDYNAEIDQNLMAAMLEVYYNDVPKEFHSEALTKVAKDNGNDFKTFTANYFKTSPFTSKEKLASFLDGLTAEKLEAEPLVVLMNGFISTYISKVATPKGAAQSSMVKAQRLFADGLRKMNPGKTYAPNANSTMRVTYGNVLAYDAKDGVTYKNQTTLAGVMDKDAHTEDVFHEFYVHDKLRKLYDTKDYGQYGQDGVMNVCFLSNNDITGGNSGSPVINAKGQLIGCAFDGNWEAMSGDIYFEPNIQRTISADIRYILFIVDKYAGAGHLVEEMTLVNDKPKKNKKYFKMKKKESNVRTVKARF